MTNNEYTNMIENILHPRNLTNEECFIIDKIYDGESSHGIDSWIPETESIPEQNEIVVMLPVYDGKAVDLLNDTIITDNFNRMKRRLIDEFPGVKLFWIPLPKFNSWIPKFKMG